MTMYWGLYTNGAQVGLDVTWTQNVAGNYSDVRFRLYWAGQWTSSANTWMTITASGTVATGNFGAASIPTGTTLMLDRTHRYYHNGSGDLTLTSVYGAINSEFGAGLREVFVGNIALPRIPRQPSAPTRPSMTGSSHNSLTIEFRHQGSIGATKFELQRATNPNFSGATTISSTGISTITGLTPGTTYYFRARSGNAAGWSNWGPTLTTYTRPQANTPTADSVTATGLRARFGYTGGAAGSTTWTLQLATNSSFTAGLQTVSSSGTTVFSNLTPGTTYYLRARGSNSSGAGPWSGTRTVTTATLLPPGLSVAPALTGSSATVTITAPAGASVSSYTLEAEYLTPTPKPSGADKSLTTALLSPTVNGLIPGATYRWRVRANIGSYSTGWSSWVTATQFNPGALDADYFDATLTSTDPNVQRSTAVVGGRTIQVERAKAPAMWLPRTPWPYTDAYVGSSRYLNIRSVTGNMVPSEGSTRSARVKVIRPITEDLGWAIDLVGPSNERSVVLPSATYTAKVFVRSTMPIDVQITMTWADEETFSQGEVYGERIVTTPGEIHELTIIAKSTEYTVYGAPSLRIRNADIGAFLDLDGGFLGLGRIGERFDGGTPDTYRYVHEWEGEVWNSQSTRTTLADASPPDPFLDPLCPAPPSAPRPPVPENECIPDVPTWRRYFSPLEAGMLSAAFDSLPTFTITTGQLADGPVRIQIFENPDNLSVEEFIPGEPISTQVVSYMPALSEVVLDAVSERAYGRALNSDSYSNVAHLLTGAGGGPATWPTVGCGMPHMIVMDVPASSPLGNVKLSAELTTRMG